MDKNPARRTAKILFPDDAKAFMDEHKEGSYVLLDVRQPLEYEESHLPGAKLIPLPVLAQSRAGLDPAQPVIVYCAVGGRSRMAAQLLAGQGFQEVYQLEGGIEAWEGQPATGPREFHLKFVRGDEPPEEMLLLAYRMEEGMRRFHELVRSQTQDAELAALLTRLVSAEESHKSRLLKLHPQLRDILAREQAASGDQTVEIMEGGVEIDQFIKENRRFLASVRGVLDVAMMVETQALDLYLRMADESANPETKQILLGIADEEKEHLAALGRVMDQKAAG